MGRSLLNQIVEEVTNHSSFFHDNTDCTGREEYLRKPTMTDVVKLYWHYEKSTGFQRCCEALIALIGSGYYLVDMIYLELATLVKMISEPSDDDHKRIRYKQIQESVRKDVEQEFGVLNKK
ncbi:DNA-directed DNA polymerase [Tanacetum coccineum]|uniref:DNA-directed DNA polymerase n=1 Tax=Tanacetum coccineum TaxID=301880 RepID=A0ABQ4Z2J4_9ASTR